MNRAVLMIVLLGTLGCPTHPSLLLPSDVTVMPWGYTKAMVASDGTLTPRWLGSRDQAGLCLDAPLARDTSQWRVRIRFPDHREPDPPPLVVPTATAGTNLCFKRAIPPSVPASPALKVCATVHDDFDDQWYDVPCFTIRYDTHDTDYASLQERIGDLMSRQDEMTTAPLLAAADQLTVETEASGFPFLALYPRLLAIHRLREDGTSDSSAQADSRMASFPPWLSEPNATPIAIPVAIERAKLARARKQPHSAWQHLVQARALASRYASARHIAVAMEEAALLVQLGQRDEPRRRLTAALAQCARWPCARSHLPEAHSLHAWLILIDPDASSAALDLAGTSLRQAMETTGVSRGKAEQANLMINRALLDSRLEHDPHPLLEQAYSSLEPLEPTPRRAALTVWAQAVEGLDQLRQGNPDAALTICAPPIQGNSMPRAASWLWGCRGRAYRSLGALAAAHDAWAHAIRLAITAQLTGADQGLGQDLQVAPGRLADHVYQAARVAIERQRPDDAWSLLVMLDRVAAQVACTSEADTTTDDLARQRDALRDGIRATQAPLAPARERQLAPVRDALRTDLDAMLRAASAQCAAIATDARQPADLRAFPLDDEVILLARDQRGATEVAGRTPLSRPTVQAILDQVEAMQDAHVDDEAWRAATMPLARALVPPATVSLGPRTHYALHGLLQRAPLTGLPDADRWLIDRTIPVFQPSLVEVRPEASSSSTSQPPVFVVDPRRDLPTGTASRDIYRQRFPSARILHGDQATIDALRDALADTSFLHVDAHGKHDAAFLQLSGVYLRDGLLTLGDLPRAILPREFINLGSCHIGQGEPSGDSGRYGFAGALARRGVPWVIASAAALDDRLAFAFNQAFYEAIHIQADVPSAFSRAIARIRADHKSSSWARLRLISAGEGANPAPTRLPTGKEEVDDETG